ncbi:MAG: hypothetical protein JO054_08620 [Actinobacteria bacterium]|nr:hypothetical protein [Actinomycetota bacterium]
MSVLVALGWWFGVSLAAGVVLGRLLEQVARTTTMAPAPMAVGATEGEMVEFTVSPGVR